MTRGVDELFHDGFCVYDLSQADSLLLSQTLKAAYDFFQLDEATKRRDYFPGLHVGYRFSGIEYSATPDRPDLNDSINLSSGWQRSVADTSAAFDFYQTADRLLAVLDALAQSLLLGVAQRYPGSHQPPETAHHSWLQVNYYRSFPAMRDVLQDKHEDGHLLTVWHSAKPGFEIFPHDSEIGTPVTLDDEHMLVMPGSLLTLLTGGDIAPLHHRVVRSAASEGRMALMYFVNPTAQQPLYSYKPGTGAELEDIAAIGARNPQHFGLPQLEQPSEH